MRCILFLAGCALLATFVHCTGNLFLVELFVCIFWVCYIHLSSSTLSWAHISTVCDVCVGQYVRLSLFVCLFFVGGGGFIVGRVWVCFLFVFCVVFDRCKEATPSPLSLNLKINKHS